MHSAMSVLPWIRFLLISAPLLERNVLLAQSFNIAFVKQMLRSMLFS
jgi:hypothetical protein